ncbi:hypothetical protein BJY04DRAFT_217273 [Aspergillus karnatakaensis]|uniref:uncharacterized protein n=1 Tax=Aspergillus karnatakaensis TaxID=1810916 RepID=UPI003CCCDA19
MASIRTQRARLSQLHPQFHHLAATRLQQQPPHPQFNLRHSSTGKSHARPPSSAQPTGKTVPSTTSTSTTQIADDINPPPSTRPAEIVHPEPAAPDATAGDKAKRYINVGRAFYSFYKTGLKNVYNNYKASLPIRKSLGIPSALPSTPPLSAFLKSSSAEQSKELQIKDAELRTSRSTFQLLNRAAYDVRRMIPFSLVLIVCGELTPLAVLILGNSITPYTCRVPKQIEKYRSQRTDLKRKALSAHLAASEGSVSVPGPGSAEEMDILSKFTDKKWIENEASVQEVIHACVVMGIVKSMDGLAIVRHKAYRKKLSAFAQYLEVDDQFIREGGGVSALEAAEVRIAVEERAGYGLSSGGGEGWEIEREERRWLEKWLERRE